MLDLRRTVVVHRRTLRPVRLNEPNMCPNFNRVPGSIPGSSKHFTALLLTQVRTLPLVFWLDAAVVGTQKNDILHYFMP